MKKENPRPFLLACKTDRQNDEVVLFVACVTDRLK